VPIVYSLNRGLWIGLGLACLYLIVRVGGRTRFALCAAAATGALVFTLSPLASLVGQRLDNPHSNDIRAFTVSATLAAGAHSPIIGYGNTRNAMGNHLTITTGKTEWCGGCGHPPLGSDGQLWLLIITQGFAGAALYVAFFLGAIRRHWADRSPIGLAGVLVMALVLLYMFVYDGLVTPLSLYLISFALLWRNDTALRGDSA
jgi:O-antigen ligase